MANQLLQRIRLAIFSPFTLSPGRAKKAGAVVVYFSTVLNQKNRLGAFVAKVEDPTFAEPHFMSEIFCTREGLITYHAIYKILSYFASFLSAHERPIFIYGDNFKTSLKIHLILNEKEFTRERASLWDTLSSFSRHNRPVYIVTPLLLYREQRKLRKIAKEMLARELVRL